MHWARFGVYLRNVNDLGVCVIQSMTAFARVQKELDIGSLSWEIRSINHRYLDISFHLPEAFRYLEPDFRRCLRDKISRGKVDCQLKHQDTNVNNPSMLINIGMVNALKEVSDKLSLMHHLPNDLAVSQILSWPGVLQKASLEGEGASEAVMSLFEEACQNLVKARCLEGSALKTYINSRLRVLNDVVSDLQTKIPIFVAKTKEKLWSRLESLDLKQSEERIAQEIAMLLARFDVTEELDRLKIHIGEVARILDSESIAGRRLDFLMQELYREGNTLSSKSDTIDLSQAAVEIKVLIEQMREQIQNIE